MIKTDYYVIKGTSKLILDELLHNRQIKMDSFSILMQAIAFVIKDDNFSKLPREFHSLRSYLSTYGNHTLGCEEGFDFGAIYSSLKLLDLINNS